MLVVDDDKLLRELLCNKLERKGHDVMTVGNGKEAEKCCRQLSFDVAIVNIHMPVQEGMETLLVLNNEYQDIKLIAMTGEGKTSLQMYLDVVKQLVQKHTEKNRSAMQRCFMQ